MRKPTVVFIATYDTKGEESEFIKELLENDGVACVTIDVGVGRQPRQTPDVSLESLCQGYGRSANEIRVMNRGEAVAAVSDMVRDYVSGIQEWGEADAIIGIGGAGGTQIVTHAMRALPFGLPKLMLSTLASGNTRWYLQDSDICMMPSVIDVAGINAISRLVFERFAAAAAAQARWYHRAHEAHRARMEDERVFRIGLTMYGTTTNGVTEAREELEKLGYETAVFHASGAGGRAMEGFVRSGTIRGVLDMTLAEVGAHLVGGLHDGGEDRLDTAIACGVPLVLVPGAADTVVLPPMSELPDRFREGRVLNFHNPTMTTMRTNVKENERIGAFIAEKLSRARRPVKLLLPMGGLSSIDRPGAIFYMPEANEALFETLKNGLRGTMAEVIEDPRHIYDEGFGRDAARLMADLIKTYQAL